MAEKILQTVTLLQIKVHYLMTALHKAKCAGKLALSRY